MAPSREEFARSFRNAGYRLTRQRELIFEHLGVYDGTHPSARQVYRELRARDAGISIATVYNTLGTLHKLGLIKVIEFESLDNRYEKNLEPHVNLICTECGNIQDLNTGPDIHIECARKKAGFKVDDFRLEYYGSCAGCLSKTSPDATRKSRD